MTEIWIWTVWEQFPERVESAAESPEETTEESPPPDLAGFSVDASDGHIGEIDEANFDAGSGCIIVDTGFWIFGKKRMVPAGMIEKIDTESKKVVLSCSKADVKAAPDYDPERVDDPGHRDEVGQHYEGVRDLPVGPGAEKARAEAKGPRS